MVNECICIKIKVIQDAISFMAAKIQYRASVKEDLRCHSKTRVGFTLVFASKSFQLLLDPCLCKDDAEKRKPDERQSHYLGRMSNALRAFFRPE